MLYGVDILANNIDTTSKDCILEAIDTFYTIVVDALLQGSGLYIMKEIIFLSSGGLRS